MAALSGLNSYEFKALFSVIHAALRARNAASGGEEMLRLRTYDKLQNLVRHGQVKKTGKKYKGVTNALLVLSESLKEFRKNGPSFSPGRRSLANDGLQVAMERKLLQARKSVKLQIVMP